MLSAHSWPEKLKSPGKKTREIKQINFTIFFITKFHFLQFQKRPKSIFELGKSLKLTKMQFHKNFF